MSNKTWSTRTLRIIEVTSLTILLLLIGAVTLVTFTTPAKKQVHIESQPEQYIRAISASARIAPTTTTTQPKRSVKSVGQSSTPARTPSVPSGDWVAQCKTWFVQAGIAEENWDAALYIIDHESDCNPTVRNPNSSAGGIPQALPWTKMGCLLEYSDQAAICQLRWMQTYVLSRYSSWEQAVDHSRSVGWY